MEDKMITQKELAERWSLAEATLERWRSIGIGPHYVKLMSRVRYRLSDVEAFEAAGLTTPARPSRTSHISVLPQQSPLAKKQQQNADVFAKALSSLQAPSNTCYGN
jgi:hypothetical protein